MDDQIDERVKEARNQDLLAVVDAAAKRAGARLVGANGGNSLRRSEQDERCAPDGSHSDNKIVVFEGAESDIGATDRSPYHALDRLQPVRDKAEGRRRVVIFRRWKNFSRPWLRFHDLSPFLAHRRFDRWGRSCSARACSRFFCRRKISFRNFLVRETAGAVLLTIDLVWSFWLLATMEMGEFSNFRRPLLIILPIGFVLVLRFVDEFLAVRALGILCLLAAEPLLDAAFLRPEMSRLLVTVLAYLMIVAGLVLGHDALPAARPD